SHPWRAGAVLADECAEALSGASDDPLPVALDRLVALGIAGVLGFDLLPIGDHAVGNLDTIGLCAQRFAGYRNHFGPDACAPARTAQIWVRHGNADIGRL